MPFLGEYRGGPVVPEEVPDEAQLTCRNCGGDLRVRQTHERDGAFVARHFWHINGGGTCSGGEFDTHRRLKSIVLSKLKHLFPYEEGGLERQIGRNIADL